MVALPHLSVPCIFYYNVPECKMARSSTNVSSLLDIKNSYALAQTTAANQPVLSLTGIQTNYGGANTWGSSDYDLSFTASSSQYMVNNAAVNATNIGTALSQQDFTMAWCSSCSSIAGSTGYVWSLGHSTLGGYFRVGFGGNNVTIGAKNDAGTTVSATHSNDGLAHAYVLVKHGANLTLRVDGIQVAQLTTLSGTYSLDTFTVGASNTGGTAGNFYNGDLLLIAGWQGAVDAPKAVETYLLTQVGGTNTQNVNEWNMG
jgi:hypothetical protein